MSSAFVPEIGREITLSACGRDWVISRLEINVLERFMDWIRPQLPDPFEGLDKIIAALPPDKAMELVREAKAEKRGLLDYGSPDVQRTLSTMRGKVHLFLFMLQVKQPDATLNDAIAIADEIGQDRLTEVFAAAGGKGPSGGKGQAPASTSGASNLSTGERSAAG